MTRMHCTFLAPELSATSSIERGWIIGQDTRVRILLIRHRFSLESGRVSSISTRSPTRLSFASSCALTFLALRTTRSYRGCRYTRSILTTRVFCMASLTTTASRVFRSPSAMPLGPLPLARCPRRRRCLRLRLCGQRCLALGRRLLLLRHGLGHRGDRRGHGRRRRLRPSALLAQDGQGPSDVAPRLAEPGRVLGHAHRELEAQIENFLGQLADLLPHLVLAQIPPLGRFHPLPLRAPARGRRTSSGYPSSDPRS